MVLEELDEEGRGQVEAVGPVRRRTELTDLGKIILLKGKFMFLDNCELSQQLNYHKNHFHYHFHEWTCNFPLTACLSVCRLVGWSFIIS